MGWLSAVITWVRELFTSRTGTSTLEEVMGEVFEVLVKKAENYPKKWCLIHNDKYIFRLISPGSHAWTGADRTMLVGSEAELRAVIDRLGLTLRPNSRVEV